MKPQTIAGVNRGHRFDIKFTHQGGWIPKWDETFSQCPNIKSVCHYFLFFFFPSVQSVSVLSNFKIKLKVQCRRLDNTEWQTEPFHNPPLSKVLESWYWLSVTKIDFCTFLFLHSKVFFFPLFLAHSLLTLGWCIRETIIKLCCAGI